MCVCVYINTHILEELYSEGRRRKKSYLRNKTIIKKNNSMFDDPEDEYITANV